jgi:DNA-binding response OmpR family regulator
MRSVLVVDDEDSITLTLCAVLEDEGYRCHTASNGREGLEVLARERPELVLVDVMMPLMDGREMVRQLRQDRSFDGVRVVVMSAARDALKGESIGQDGCLEKPFALEDLLQLVAELLPPHEGFCVGGGRGAWTVARARYAR